jgi:hypothetical protein
MSIEKKIEDLIASIDANTQALIALAAAPVAADKPDPVKTPNKPKVVKEEPKKVEAPTETVGSMIEKMLKANKRKEAIELLKSFSATKASDILEENVEAFIEGAQSILLGA